MDSYYDAKQQCRRRELNSRRASSQKEDRKRRNQQKKQSKLVRENQYDYHQDYTKCSIQCEEDLLSYPPSSPISDDEIIESRAMTIQHRATVPRFTFSTVTEDTPMDQAPDMSDLARRTTPDRPLAITPVHQCFADPDSMKNKCRRAVPSIDQTILRDLQRAFNNPPTCQLSNILGSCQRLPYWIRGLDGQLEEKAKEFMSDYGLTEQQLFHIDRINKQVTFRSSHGVLLLQGDKFFAKTTLNRGNRRSAIKGYPTLKPTGEWEHPWETAVRVTARYVQYWNSEIEGYQCFNMDEHMKGNEHQHYLECLITSLQHTEQLRYIGLFIIRLKADVQIRVNDYYQMQETNYWYSIEEKVDDPNFYSIRPFLKYLQEHPNFA